MGYISVSLHLGLWLDRTLWGKASLDRPAVDSYLKTRIECPRLHWKVQMTSNPLHEKLQTFQSKERKWHNKDSFRNVRKTGSRHGIQMRNYLFLWCHSHYGEVLVTLYWLTSNRTWCDNTKGILHICTYGDLKKKKQHKCDKMQIDSDFSFHSQQ